MEFSADDNNFLQKSSVEHRDSRDHLANDTTDDEQEDLPYDGILECYLVPSVQHDNVATTSTSINSHQAPLSTEESHPPYSLVQTETTNDEALYSLDSSDSFSLSQTVSNPQANDDIMEREKLPTISTIIPDVLLRHITEGNLLNPSEFIDYETMPEISIVESSDETAISRKSHAKLPESPHYEEQEDFKEEYLEMYGKESNSIQEDMTNEANSDIGESSTIGNNEENKCESIQENEEEDDFPPDDMDKESKQPTYESHRRPSYEMKYGQGQVHYKLPDFSKVPPKVKIPKCDNGSPKPSHTIKRAPTSTNLIGQSFLIQDILDSMQPVIQLGEIKKEQQILVNSDFNCEGSAISPPALEWFPSSLLHEQNQSDTFYLGLLESHPKLSGLEEAVTEEAQNMECARVPTEGEKMAGLLMEQAQTLKNEVFQNFKSCIEMLEIDYLSTKEKHRDLQLQIYRTGSQTVGEFDIEREVEGQIFRLGMLLEDIQEQMSKSDENKAESASLTASSTSYVLSPAQETEVVGDPTTGSNTDKAVTRSPNRTTVSELQIQQELPIVNEAMDSLHSLHLYPDMSTVLPDSGVDSVLIDHCPVNSVNQLAIKEAIVVSNDAVPLILSGQSCKLRVHGSFSQEKCSEDWIFAKPSGFAEKREITTKTNKNIEESSQHLRYQAAEIRKIERKFRKPRNLSISVQETAVNLDLANSLSSSSSSCKKSTNRRVPPADKLRNLLHPETTVKEYPKQKSMWPSTFPLCVQNQSGLSNRLHHIRSNVSHYMTSSRSSGKSVFQHSQLTNSTISTVQRKRWRNVTPNNLDYIDSKILHYVLDNALRTAKNMQKTTEKMVQRLASDLANPPSYRSSCAV
ncbi:protein AKNAD1 [Ranitomeya variabilis]|uniref:protein AKNAD1 n=1 Tax=Ranitomeya variabilis TaxID=490064 RepID=UPI00405779E2